MSRGCTLQPFCSPEIDAPWAHEKRCPLSAEFGEESYERVITTIGEESYEINTTIDPSVMAFMDAIYAKQDAINQKFAEEMAEFLRPRTMMSSSAQVEFDHYDWERRIRDYVDFKVSPPGLFVGYGDGI